jgi:ABC-2 type transport system permease protein
VLTAVSSGAKPGQSLFDVTLATKEQAGDLLKNSRISGYIDLDWGARVFIKDSGLSQTILKEFVDDYVQTSTAAQTILGKNPAAAQNFAADIAKNTSYLKEVTPTRSPPNSILNYFYALIAMACLYGGFLGLKEVAAVQADLTPKGARVNMAPVHKLKIFGYALCAATTVHLISILVLIAFLDFVLKISFGGQLGYVLLACVAGCFAGVSLGAMIGALIKKGEGVKIAVLISVSMVLSALSGMYYMGLKYLVTSAFPPMAYINPANLITDAFYSLYYYNSHTRFFINIGLLFGFSAVFYLITYFVLRRQKYASL